MRLSITNFLLALCAASTVVASPMPADSVSPGHNGLTARSPSSDLTHIDMTNSARDVKEADDSLALVGDIVPRDNADSLISKFKIHVVTASAKVIGIIIIDYVIEKLVLPGANENIHASYDKLTNVKTEGHIVATHFDNPPTLFNHPQSATFDFKTSVVSGVVDLGLNAAGQAVSLASTAGIHLGTNVVAKALHIFNENNERIGTHTL